MERKSYVAVIQWNSYVKIMTEYELDPLTGDPIPKQREPLMSPQSPANASLSAEQLAKLEDMSRIELIALIERMARQCGMVAGMTEEQTAQAMLDTLAHTALMPIVPGISMKADIQSRLSAIDKWLDRTKGKPVQAINQTSTVAMLVQGLQPDVELLKRIKNDLINGLVIDN